MKKVILSLVVVAALSTASCKKNYTCTCTVTIPGLANETVSYTIDDTKSKAKTACTAEQTTATSVYAGTGATATCAIN